MLLIISRNELNELDTSIFTLNHSICTDIVKEVYPRLANKPKILITGDFVKENYYLNEERLVSLIKSFYFLTGNPVVYMTKTLDYIASKYNTEDYIMIVNEDILTYPVMSLDSIIEDTDLRSHVKTSGITVSDAVYKGNKFLSTLELFTNQSEYTNYLNNHIEDINNIFSLFKVITQDNNLMKKQIAIKSSTYDNLVEKIKLLEDEKLMLLDKIKEISTNYNDLYNTMADTMALLNEYKRIYDSLKIYGVYNESMHLKKYTNTNTISISKHPIVFYIKEYAYQDLFMEFIVRLPKLLKDNYGLLSKVVVLENTDTIREVEYRDFIPYINGVTLAQFIDFDRWINYGNSEDIMNLLAHNEASQDLYVIWDRTNFKNDFIQGNTVSSLAMIDDVSKCDMYKLNPANCISPMTTPLIDRSEYNKLLPNERLLNAVLSNTKLYLQLYRLYTVKRGEQ